MQHKLLLLHEKYTFQEGLWKWTRTGEQVEFTDWCSGEPNNGGVDKNEHCLHLWFGSCDFKWNDCECFEIESFNRSIKPVCQRDI